MKQLDLKPVGLTDRMEHNATAANFAQIEDAVNSNAITAEEMYAELNGKLAAEDHALDHKYAAEIDRLDQADSDIKSLITSVEKRLNVRIDDLASDMRAADESNLAAMTAKAERVAVGSDGPTFIRMLGWALHDPKIRDVVANIVKE